MIDDTPWIHDDLRSMVEKAAYTAYISSSS